MDADEILIAGFAYRNRRQKLFDCRPVSERLIEPQCCRVEWIGSGNIHNVSLTHDYTPFACAISDWPACWRITPPGMTRTAMFACSRGTDRPPLLARADVSLGVPRLPARRSRRERRNGRSCVRR